ncbi:MAG TPA: type III-A CRISPR-associated RAMP protein Csm4 [Candidatus Hydrogenedens sp.]|nr:type III-A CRISPR-associated RAMP protein Csm4 [Candidatus Hydrogenedens sp.]
MPYYRVKLKPNSPFFKGINSHARKSTAIVHSDVLHSAFLCVSSTIDPYWLREDRAKNLLLSSIYPYYNSIYLYPKPFVPSTDDSQDEKKEEEKKLDTADKSDRKKWKKVKYVSEGLFAKLLVYKDAGKEDYPYLDGNKGTTLCLDTELNEIKKEGGLPTQKIVKENYKISTVIDRVTNQATPYPQNYYEINTEEGVGLWFLVKLEETELESFEKVLSALGKLGIGGERTSGFGQFSIVKIIPLQSNNLKQLVDKDILVVSGHENLDLNTITTLSLYHPTKEEFNDGILNGIASYECTVRGGWIHDLAGGDNPKMSIRMCIEGSIFPAKDGKPKGDVLDISYNEEPHPIWRSGLALNIYFQLPEKEIKK